jgi:hypothetical protein
LDVREAVIGLVGKRSEWMSFMQTLMSGMYDSDANEFQFTVLGSPVCPTAFREFWHLTQYGLELLCRCIRNDRDYPIHANALLDKDDAKTRQCQLYLHRLEHVSEHQPDSEEVHLIERTTKTIVFEAFQAELAPLELPEDIASYPTFTRTWKKHFPHLKIPRECRLGRCDVCEDLSEKIKTSKGQRRERFRALKQQHNRQCKIERLDLEAKMERARSTPNDWTCLATDWSNPHYMPHKAQMPKTCFGICNYGTHERILYPHFDWWPHDANLHISFLFCYLRELKESGTLGKNLMLQMDNCWRDNKNKWFFGFLAQLIDMNWFDSVEIYYLSPGHSHAMVDRECFKALGRHARAIYSYWTPDAFWTGFVVKAFRHTRKKLRTLSNVVVWNWKEWLEPNLRHMKFHSFQRAFLLQKEDGLPVLRFKANSLKNNWRGLKSAPENGLRILRLPENSEPEVILPTPLPDEEFVDIQNLSGMPAHIQTYWESFQEQQFDADFGVEPEDWFGNFWLPEESSVSSEATSTTTSEENEDVPIDRNVHVIDHPQVIPLDELQAGCIIACRPRESYYEEYPDETRENFWLAKILRLKTPKVSRNNRIHRFLVCWYSNDNLDNPNLPAKYSCDENFTNVIHYESIVYHNLEFTLRQGLRVNDVRKINFRLNMEQ